MSHGADIPLGAGASERGGACPHCGAGMAPGAVLCIDCGFDTKLGRRLDTIIERPLPPPRDDNPYAPPAPLEWDESPKVREPAGFDLNEVGVRRAEAVVSAAESVRSMIFLAWCICTPAWLVMLPWYTFRLIGWYDLNRTFAELRSPNGFSPNVTLAVKFQDARAKLWAGVIVSAIFCALFALVFIVNFVRRV